MLSNRRSCHHRTDNPNNRRKVKDRNLKKIKVVRLVTMAMWVMWTNGHNTNPNLKQGNGVVSMLGEGLLPFINTVSYFDSSL